MSLSRALYEVGPKLSTNPISFATSSLIPPPPFPLPRLSDTPHPAPALDRNCGADGRRGRNPAGQQRRPSRPPVHHGRHRPGHQASILHACCSWSSWTQQGTYRGAGGLGGRTALVIQWSRFVGSVAWTTPQQLKSMLPCVSSNDETPTKHHDYRRQGSERHRPRGTSRRGDLRGHRKAQQGME